MKWRMTRKTKQSELDKKHNVGGKAGAPLDEKL